MTDPNAPFSLLFADPTLPEEPWIPKETMEFLGEIPCEDPAVLGRILSCKTTHRDRAFRKEILEDFLQNPSLLTKLETVLRRRDLLCETARREATPTPQQTKDEAMECLKDTAMSLLEHLKFLRHASEELEGQAPESVGLFAFSEYLRRRGSCPEVKQLTEQLALLPLLRKEQTEFVLWLNPDRYGMMQSADLLYVGADSEKFLKKIPPSKDGYSARIPKGEVEELTVLAICRLCTQLRTLSAGIRAAFEPLREGLVFYHFALSVTEWGREKGFGWLFPTPVNTHGPQGRGIRNALEQLDGAYRPPFTCTARALEAYEGKEGTEALRALTRIQLFAAAGLPAVAEKLEFCPEERVLVCDLEEKTAEEESEALANLYRQIRPGDIVMLNHPWKKAGTAPTPELLGNLLRAFHKKGAAVRLATDPSVD